jgi:hypothetical protein
VAIAGIYGMNFKNMPELDTQYGYVAVLGVITALRVVHALQELGLAVSQRDKAPSNLPDHFSDARCQRIHRKRLCQDPCRDGVS